MNEAIEKKGKLRQWYRELKENAECTECGFKHPAAIEFHHKDPMDKKFAISTMVQNGMDISLIKEELKKCIPLCANHHRIIHYDECSRTQARYGTQMQLGFNF